MTTIERDELRALQDRYLALPGVRRFVAASGVNVPLWTSGPTVADVSCMICPVWRHAFAEAIRNHERGSS